MRTVFVAVALLALLGIAAAVDKDVEVGDIQCKVKGQSGKIQLTSKAGRKQSVVIDFDSITERAADGTAVGTSGNNKHSFRNFASQDFTFSNAVSTHVDDVPVTTFNFSATFFSGAANLDVQVYLFKKNGTVIFGDEETDVTAGMLKFNIVMANWPFCTAGGTGNNLCRKGGNDQVGTDLDFQINVISKSPRNRTQAGRPPTRPCKSPKKQGQQCKRPEKIDLGDGAGLDLSTVVMVDNVWQDMATGYPSTNAKGQRTEIVFRFPKFTSVFYDPALSLGINPDAGDNAAGLAAPGVVVTLVAMVACLLAMLQQL